MCALPLWSVARLEEAVYRLGGRSLGDPATLGAIADGIQTARDLQPWLYSAVAKADLEAEPLHVQGADLADALRAAAPVLVVVAGGALAVKRVRGVHAVLLSSEGREERVPFAAVCSAVEALWAVRYGLDLDDQLACLGELAPERLDAVGRSLVRLQLASRQIEIGWSIRPSSAAPLGEQLRYLGQQRSLTKLALAFFGIQAAFLGSWYLLGRSALSGSFDPGWLCGWALAFATAGVLQVLSSFWEGCISIAVGEMLKKRLLLGALRSDPAVLRHHGLGRAMGRVLEAEALEELSLSGGFLCVLAGGEMLVVLPILLQANLALLAAFICFVVAVVVACVAYYQRTRAWTDERLRLTEGLVDSLTGRRTRMLQGDPNRVHAEEDSLLAHYVLESQGLDRVVALATVLIPRGWLIVGIATLVPLIISRDTSSASLWLALGGTLLGQRALDRFASGASALFSAAVAWRSAKPLIDAARRPDECANEYGLAASLATAKPGETFLECRQVGFQFAPDRPSVLRDLNLRICAGEHLLLEGRSGSGKSTLVSLLAGLEQPKAGLILLGGLDRSTLGSAVWRRKVAFAPQQHDNHILQGTLGFNLLLGAEWPPSPDELGQAEQVCQELGLGDLLDRMPSRLSQPVGTAGWRLSHGEQSRIYLARALLQGSELVVLDESLAALDPETLEQVLSCVRKRASTLLVIAHP